jgi:hypothetical protein
MKLQGIEAIAKDIHGLGLSPLDSQEEIREQVEGITKGTTFRFLGAGFTKVVVADSAMPGRAFGIHHVLMNPEYGAVLQTTAEFMATIAPHNIPAFYGLHQFTTGLPASSLGRGATLITVAEKQLIVPDSARVQPARVNHPIGKLFTAVTNHFPTSFFETKDEDVLRASGKEWYVDDVTPDSDGKLTSAGVLQMMEILGTPKECRETTLLQMHAVNRALLEYSETRR